MTIEFTEATRAFWYVDIPAPRGNWIAAIDEAPGGGFTAQYRFRWYRDDKDFDSADEKNWWTIKGDDLQEALGLVRKIACEMVAMGAGPMYELTRAPGDKLEDFLARFQRLPFAKARTETIQ